jgi:16S rRNA (guanine966-N2)-methyltransferase
MRIIAGTWRSRRLEAPAGLDTRPTTDRTREALFSHLQSARLPAGWSGQRVLDLFAGTGALGLEALSRGAAQACLVDSAPAALQALRHNVKTLDAHDRCQVVQAALPEGLERLTTPGGWQLVFMDAPYDGPTGPRTLAALATHRRSLLAPGAWIVYEHRRQHPPALVPGLLLRDTRTWGDTALWFLQPDENAP